MCGGATVLASKPLEWQTRSGSEQVAVRTVLGVLTTAIEAPAPAPDSEALARLPSSALMKCVGHALTATALRIPNSKATVFDSARVPQISMADYLQRLHVGFQCSDSAWVCALVILDRVLRHYEKEPDRFNLTTWNIHRLFLTCLVLSVKQNEDSIRSNRLFARVGGITCAELNELEELTFQLLGYRLYCDPAEYQLYLDRLIAFSVPLLEDEDTEYTEDQEDQEDQDQHHQAHQVQQQIQPKTSAKLLLHKADSLCCNASFVGLSTLILKFFEMEWEEVDIPASQSQSCSSFAAWA